MCDQDYDICRFDTISCSNISYMQFKYIDQSSYHTLRVIFEPLLRINNFYVFEISYRNFEQRKKYRFLLFIFISDLV